MTSPRRTWRSNPQLVAALHELGATSADDLLPLLDAPDESIAARACWALGLIGTRTHCGVLLRVLQGNRPGLWMQSATSLTLLESKRPTPHLIKLVLDQTRPTEQRYAATYALAFSSSALNDPRYTKRLCHAFLTLLTNEQEAAYVRGQAAEGLGNMLGGCFGAGGERGATYDHVGQALIGVLNDPEPEVRFWAAFALGSLGYRPALPALALLANNDAERFGNWWTVGEEASDAIDRIEGREPPDRELCRQ